MTCSLVVNSKSGNTRMVSGAIKRALQAAGVEFVHAAALSDDADADQVALEAQGACAADTVLVGFWCDKGACTPSVAALLSALHGKRVFLFGTCGFGADQSYYQQIVDRVTSNLAEDAELAGWAMCQGKMGPAVKQRYEAMLEQDPDNARFKMLLDNWVAAKDHPTLNTSGYVFSATCYAQALQFGARPAASCCMNPIEWCEKKPGYVWQPYSI